MTTKLQFAMKYFKLKVVSFLVLHLCFVNCDEHNHVVRAV